MVGRVALIALAALVAIVPLPPAAVERFYSTTVYPLLQRPLTGVSNLAPFAVFDALCVGAVMWLVGMAVRDAAERRNRGWGTVAGQSAMRALTAVAIVYLAFVGSWGLNYRRVPLAEKLQLDLADVSAASVRALAVEAVDQVNVLYDEATGDRPTDVSVVDPRLVQGFVLAQQSLGVRYPARPARPKRTVLDPYFRAAAVQGMTAPFFMETLVPSDLLGVEQPSVVAHEWSHLAGFADEGEASFVAWLACLSGPPGARYSGWLSLYGEAVTALPPSDRDEVSRRLAQGPRDDLRAIADRWRRNVRPAVSSAGWRVYDRYLRANRIEAGAASYGHVVRLVIGTELGRRRASGN